MGFYGMPNGNAPRHTDVDVPGDGANHPMAVAVTSRHRTPADRVMESGPPAARVGVISRRRLLRLAAYAAPAATLLNLAAASRALAQSHGGTPAPSAEGRWIQTSTLLAPPRRRRHTLAASGVGLVFLFGGQDSAFLGDTWAFDLRSGGWRLLDASAGPSSRIGHGLVAGRDGRIYLFGGYRSGAGYLGDTWRLDPATNIWTRLSPAAAPPPRGYHAMAAGADGRIYLFGGNTNGGALLNDTWVFDTGTLSWSQVPVDGPSPRRWHAMAAGGDGRIHLFGGSDTSGYLGDTWALDPATPRWIRLPAGSPPARSSHAMAAGADGRVYLFGGRDSRDTLGDTWVLDPSAATWTILHPAPSPSVRWGHAMAATGDGRLLLFGGDNPDGNLNDTWVFETPT